MRSQVLSLLRTFYLGNFNCIYTRFEINWGYYDHEMGSSKSLNSNDVFGHGKTNLEERVLVLLERFCILDTKTETFSWNPESSWILKKSN